LAQRDVEFGKPALKMCRPLGSIGQLGAGADACHPYGND